MPLISSVEELAKEEGREEGIQIGKEEGILEGIQRVALNMLRQGMSTDEVAHLAQLSQDQVEQLRSQLEG